MEDLEILINTVISNCKDKNELQNMYITLTNKVDDLIMQRQNEIERGV